MTARKLIPMFAIALLVALAANVKAADATIDGTWKSTFKTPDGTERTTTFKFKLDGEKVTGTVSGRNNTDTNIDDGATFKDGTLTFSVTREFNGNKSTTKYTG